MEDLLSWNSDLLKIIRKSQWQTAGLPILSDKEGLDRAYNNNENIYYDGNEQLCIAGTTSIKDLFINDLTIPLRLIQYTDRYQQANQTFDDSNNNTNNMPKPITW